MNIKSFLEGYSSWHVHSRWRQGVSSIMSANLSRYCIHTLPYLVLTIWALKSLNMHGCIPVRPVVPLVPEVARDYRQGGFTIDWVHSTDLGLQHWIVPLISCSQAPLQPAQRLVSPREDFLLINRMASSLITLSLLFQCCPMPNSGRHSRQWLHLLTV